MDYADVVRGVILCPIISFILKCQPYVHHEALNLLYKLLGNENNCLLQV